MEPLVKADDLHLSYGPTHVLRGASFLIHPGDKIALVGPNGAGKTSIFKLLTGALRPDLGVLEFARDLRVSYLPQVPDIPGATPVQELLSAPTATANRLQEELEGLEAWMGSPTAWDEPDANEKMARYTDVQTRLATEKAKGKATNSPLLNDLGLPEETLDATFGSLSGGERSKVLLAKALSSAKETDLLLLDEPTNHMDIPTVEFIEQYLMDLKGSVVVSAHDKYLLDNVADRVLELDHKRVASYTGNYTSYQAQRRALAAAIAARKARQEHEVKRQLRIIEELKTRNKFDAQVTSRRTRMKHIEQVREVAPTFGKSFRLLFQAENVQRECMVVEGLSKRFGDRQLFSGVELEIEGGDKVGLIGPNGSGKSTLIKLLTRRLKPDAGEVKVKPNITIGYFDQHHEGLDPERSLIDEVRSLRDPPPPDEWSRGLLGRFFFIGDEVFKKVKELSGGERARLALAKFIVGRHNMLVLDEPTNHLDLESQEIVATALREYEGTVVVVSHNRSFLDQICTRTAVIAHRRVGVFPGNYSFAAANKPMQDFMQSGAKGRFKVLRAFKDWEKDVKFHQGETIVVTGLETQGFRRLLRWAEAEGRIELVA
ncbi:MAG TPA: ABC-F family ATP-binding cassette domain-containing protein [Candidatus Thermoplasmatota archaeon]|nr:ABC-F family ATP-binding cassette domain-containing protein [Candidatus Thermoplasmatota archaeon]